jgi:DNA-binding response OmpR family regulator
MSGIVIIEDDVLMRSLLAEWLTAEGYPVSALEGDAAPAHTPATLVILDLYMPRHLGAARLRVVRAAYPDTPIIAMSAQFRSGVRCEGPAAHALGVDRVIAKPFDRDALLHAVRSVIGSPVQSQA